MLYELGEIRLSQKSKTDLKEPLQKTQYNIQDYIGLITSIISDAGEIAGQPTNPWSRIRLSRRDRRDQSSVSSRRDETKGRSRRD